MKKQVFNPYLPLYEYIPDGEPHVFDGRLYIYGSHDRAGSAAFCLNDYVCYSADVHDLTDWRYEGVIYRKDQDPVNQNIPEDAPEQPLMDGVVPQKEEDLNPRGVHAMWAPDVARGPDGRYYLYYCLDFLPEIGVAVCDTPAGRYEYYGRVRHADGTPLGSGAGDMVQFDPGVFVEGEEIYLYSGNVPMGSEDRQFGSQVMKLEADMLTLKEPPVRLLPGIPESAGTGYEGHEFFEASSIRKIGELYYLVYSSVQSSELCYAVSDRPDGGYRYGGTLVDIGDVGLNGRTVEETVNPRGNTHGGIEEVNGQWYVFYHRQTARTNFSRQGCAEKIQINPDGSIDQAEVTSCGLNDGPLEAEGIYPASICCHHTGSKGAVVSLPMEMKMDYPYITQDLSDIDPEEAARVGDDFIQYVANVRDKTVIGYKYFSFRGGEQLSVRLRGKAKGNIKIGQKCADFTSGSIPVSVDSDEWKEAKGACSLRSGTHPLYLMFEGDGYIDISALQFFTS